HMSAVTSGFSAVTLRKGCVFKRQVCFINNYIAVHIGHGYFGGGDQIQVIFIDEIHLSLLVRQLACTITGGFVHHVWRINFFISCFHVPVQKELNQSALKTCSFAQIYRKTCTSDLISEFKSNQVVFLGQFPMRTVSIAQSLILP